MMDGTPVSVELELKAYKDSTEKIASLLDTSAQLDSMDIIMAKVNQSLASLRTQLGAVMQTQLDELTNSLNTIHAIKEYSKNIESRFENVRKNCAESIKSLGSNTKIDKVYIARKNVLSVVNQIKFMEELPNRIQLMKTHIDQDYSCLRWVYDEWLGYNAWMWTVRDQIDHINDMTMKQTTNDIFAEIFVDIDNFGQTLDEKLWEHIYRCMELAKLDPAALVRALTIIEKNQRRKDHAKIMESRGETVSQWILNDRNWVDECKERLLTAIQRRCEHAYNQGNTMKDKLRIGMQLLSDLEVVRTKLVPCFPPRYNVLQFFIDQYALVSSNTMEIYYDDPTLEPGEVLVLVEWLDSFMEEVSSWGAQDIPVFVAAKERLLHKFDVICTSRMQVWFKRILERGDTPMESDDGLLLTAVPEDIFNLIKTQAELAGEHLKEKALCEAIRICTSPISVYVDYYTHGLSESSLYSDRELCALINNNNTLREYVDGIPDILLTELSDTARNEMNLQLNGVTQTLLDLNMAAAHALGDVIIGDIDASKVLEEMNFTEEWLEQEEADGILTMTSTFQDYLNDLQVWIRSKYFLGVIMIDCLHNSVKRYFKCFGQMKTFFPDCLQFGCRIKTDYDSLMSYFTSDDVANVMKFTDRRYRNGEFIAEVMSPIRNLEIFFKQPTDAIILNGVITDEGYRLLLSLVGGKLMDGGIKVLMMARSDLDPEDKIAIMNKFSMF